MAPGRDRAPLPRRLEHDARLVGPRRVAPWSVRRPPAASFLPGAAHPGLGPVPSRRARTRTESDRLRRGLWSSRLVADGEPAALPDTHAGARPGARRVVGRRRTDRTP